MLEKDDYNIDVDNIISIFEKFCIKNNYRYKYEHFFFTIDLSEFKRKKRIYHKFIFRINLCREIHKLTLSHNGLDNTKFIIDIPSNVNSILPSIIEKFINFTFLHRKKIIDISDLYDNYREFNKNLQDPIYIRDLKINNLLNIF